MTKQDAERKTGSGGGDSEAVVPRCMSDSILRFVIGQTHREYSKERFAGAGATLEIAGRVKGGRCPQLVKAATSNPRVSRHNKRLSRWGR
jgi:hypothetical protein